MELLRITDLQKRFAEKEVLRGLNLSIPEHSIFGFVGRNGAGKTTTMKAILGLLRADGGEITVLGERVRYGENETNRQIGYLPDVPEFYSFMTAREYLALCGECLGRNPKEIQESAEELLALVGLSEEKHRIKGYSRGMKQRLGIAQALIASPKLLICDEPTSALDPIGRKEILDLLLSVRDRTTVLFSTHILSDVERICTDVALLHDGKIAMQGSVSQLMRLRRQEEFAVETIYPNGANQLLEAFSNARLTEKDTVTFTGGETEMFAVLAFMKEQGIAFRRVERMGTSLETLFLEVARA